MWQGGLGAKDKHVVEQVGKEVERHVVGQVGGEEGSGCVVGRVVCRRQG